MTVSFNDAATVRVLKVGNAMFVTQYRLTGGIEQPRVGFTTSPRTTIFRAATTEPPVCTANNIPVSHPHVTSGHLACIEAPARAAHSGGMVTSLVGAILASHVGATPLRWALRGRFAVGARRLRRSVRGRFAVGATVALAAFVLLVVPGQAAVVDPEPRVVVRTYATSAAFGDLTPALAAAAAILEDAGVGVTWANCDVAFVQRDENPCLAPLAANELAIRFVRLPPHLAEQDLVTLGDSLVDTRLRSGSLATIYVNRVSALAARCRVDVGMLLGRAIAHEIGHLLLGTAAHASSGLMRAAWSQAALRRTAAEDWRFTVPDARAIREGVRARIARLMASGKIGE